MRHFFLLLFWLAGVGIVSAQGYYIKDYRVSLELQEDASLHVTERIYVYFEEERRGIIRSIPYEGYSPVPQSGEVAWRSQYGDRYAIHINDISVDEHPFTTYTQASNQYIRIGDPDVFLTGDQVYTIRYTVYGAVQEFAEHAELPWNVIGNEWDTRIEKASFVLAYPGNQRIADEDFLAYTGYRGSKKQELRLNTLQGSIEGTTSSVLRPGQGISVAIRLPKNLFETLDIPARLITTNYVIESLSTQLALEKDGSTRVTESITINALESAPRFLRLLSLPPGTDSKGKTVYPFIEDLSVRISEIPQGRYRVSLYPSQEQTLLEITPAASFSGIYEIRLDYTVWGAASVQGKDLLIRWNLFSTLAPEPVENYSISLTLPSGYQTSGPVQLPFPRQVSDQLANVTKTDNRYEVNSNKRVIAGNDLNVNFGVGGNTNILDNLPQHVYAKEYWIQHFDKSFTIEKDGNLSVRENYYPRFRYREGTSSFHISVPLGAKREKNGYPFFEGHNILGREDRYFYRFAQLDKLEKGKIDYPYQHLEIQPGIPAEEANFVSVVYSVKGVPESKGSFYNVRFPVWVPVGEPLHGGTVNLDFEKAQEPSDVSGKIVTAFGDVVDTLQYTGSGWEAYIPDERYSDQLLFAEFQYPKSASPGHNLFSSLALFWLNNIPLVVAFGVSMLLFILWRLIGRDKPGTIIARFKPPEDMPPAEAGFIYDGKLHGEDMTALIYYWAAHGHIKIRELEGEKKKQPDYEFIKLKGLSNEAREYEKVFFNGLFASGDTVKLSSLKNSFYLTYNKSRKAFKKFERKAGYYAKGTRGFGKLLSVIGWVTGIFLGIPLLIYSFIMSDFTFGIPAFIVAVSLIVFGRIMPRMKAWSQKALDELLGFRLFIRTAESERLKTLIDEDPKYFGLTLPYAIVMGEGDRWGEKFEDILSEPPDWYEGYDSGPFSSRYFTYHMIHSMRDMRSTFTSVPAPSGGSGSSWSGGSSFGGGFSGGGGFGGGGGSSW